MQTNRQPGDRKTLIPVELGLVGPVDGQAEVIRLLLRQLANLFVDGMYNSSKVKRNEGTTEAGLPTWEELDLSGLGVRVGVSIVGFGW